MKHAPRVSRWSILAAGAAALVVIAAGGVAVIQLATGAPGDVHPIWSLILQGFTICVGVIAMVYGTFWIVYGLPLRILGRVRRNGTKAWIASPTPETKFALRTLTAERISAVPLVLLLELGRSELIIKSPTRPTPHLTIPFAAITRIDTGHTFNVTTPSECVVLAVSAPGHVGRLVRLPLLLQRDRPPRIFTMTGSALANAADVIRTHVISAQGDSTPIEHQR